MSRFYVRPSNVKGNNIYVAKDEAHHMLEVMRLKKGDYIVTFDGTGKEYEGIIKNTSKSDAVIEITGRKNINKKETVDITLAQAVPKTAKIDFIIEKSTELGVASVIPVITARTIVKLNRDKQVSKKKRWERVAVSASKQCGRIRVPEICAPEKFSQTVKRIADFDLALMACLHKGAKPLRDSIKDFKGRSLLVFIGPEGDFTADEIEAAMAGGCKQVSLGPRVLRVDTAAINILSILQYELG